MPNYAQSLTKLRTSPNLIRGTLRTAKPTAARHPQGEKRIKNQQVMSQKMAQMNNTQDTVANDTMLIHKSTQILVQKHAGCSKLGIQQTQKCHIQNKTAGKQLVKTETPSFL